MQREMNCPGCTAALPRFAGGEILVICDCCHRFQNEVTTVNRICEYCRHGGSAQLYPIQRTFFIDTNF